MAATGSERDEKERLVPTSTLALHPLCHRTLTFPLPVSIQTRTLLWITTPPALFTHHTSFHLSYLTQDPLIHLLPLMRWTGTLKLTWICFEGVLWDPDDAVTLTRASGPPSATCLTCAHPHLRVVVESLTPSVHLKSQVRQQARKGKMGPSIPGQDPPHPSPWGHPWRAGQGGERMCR